MKKNQLNELEDLFRDSLKDFSVNARADNWSEIDQTLSEMEQNDVLKQKFLDYKSTPNTDLKPQVLSTVESQTSIFYFTKRMAAAVAFLLLASYIFINNNNTESNQLDFAMIFPHVAHNDLAYELCKDPELISLDIVKTEVKSLRKKKKRSKKDSKTKQLLDIILAEDEGIESSLDSARIAAILQPSSALPFEGMTVSTNSFEDSDFEQRKVWYPLPEVDFRISIPLQILDDKEIEALLRN